MGRSEISLLSIIVLFFLTVSSWGQSQSNTADLLGTVRDQTGGVLPGVTVQVTNVQTGLTRSALTNDEGVYRVPLLPPGSYQVRAELAGFTPTTVQGITLTVGQYAEVEVTLQVSASETEIFVEGNTDIIETQKTVQSATVQEDQIDNLPINGRNYLNFALLTPGASANNALQTFSAPQTPASGLSFAGQDQRSNYVTIDGADNMDLVSNGVRASLSQDAVQEFQINRNTFSAEFGRARGGLINIVSKSGTNEYHGNAFFFFRNNRLDATNAFARLPDPPFERYEYGGSVGGPLVRDQTFFFASFEGLDRQESNFVTFLDDPSIFRPSASQQELFQFLGSTNLPNLQLLSATFTNPQFGILQTNENTFPRTLNLFEDESGVFPFEADQDLISGKIDHQFSDHNTFFARLNYSTSFDEGADFGALQAVSNGLVFDIEDFALVLADTHTFSATTLNDFKFQYGWRDFSALTNDPAGPEIILSGVAEFGREFFNPTGYTENIFQLKDSATLIRGNHTFKFGADMNAMSLNGFAEVFLGGQFSFGEAIPLASIMDSVVGRGTAQGLISMLSRPVDGGGLGRPDLVENVLTPISSVQSFNFGLPITFFQGFGDPTADVDYYQLALFAQDSWRIHPHFTLNLGIRYDTDWRPETSNVSSTTPPFQLTRSSINDRNNIAPRIGIAWDPTGSGETVIRAGYGVYYQSFFQAVAIVSQVLSGQIAQSFVSIQGLPGLEATSADIWEAFQEQGTVTADTLDGLGLTPGTTPSVILPSANNVVNPYSQHASFGVEQRLGRDWALALDYMVNRGTNLIRSRDINVRQIGENQFALPGLDPRFAQVNMIETSGSSIYHGFTASLKKRFSSHYSLFTSYTLGKAIDDTTDFITQLQPNNQRNLRAERALSTFDQRHRFVFSGILQSPYRLASADGFFPLLLADWTVSPIVTLSSGRPFNLLLGFDANGDTHEETDRPVLESGEIAGRNTGKGPAFATTDLRLSRRFLLGGEGMSVEFMFEAFNLFNSVNYSGVNNVVGGTVLANSHVSGSQDIPSNRPLGFTSAFAPRQLQFGFRFNF